MNNWTGSSRMRAGIWLGILGILGIVVFQAGAAEIEVGATREAVIDALGEPDGVVAVGDVEFLQYPRGVVELTDGSVVSSTIVSEAAHQRRLDEKQKQATEARRRAEKRRADLLREGRAKKEQVLAEETVAKRPAEEQVRYWRQFARTYPDVDVSTELKEARSILAAETRKREQALADAEANREAAPRLSSRRQRKVNRGRHSSESLDPPE